MAGAGFLWGPLFSVFWCAIFDQAFNLMVSEFGTEMFTKKRGPSGSSLIGASTTPNDDKQHTATLTTFNADGKF